jgi:tRNA(Ile)-lysidine synthase
VPAADEFSPITPVETRALFAGLQSSPGIVLAVSGGPDSTALLALAARWKKSFKRSLKLLAVTVDHGLRPESRHEAAAVKRLARSLGVPHRIMRWSGKKPATGLQSKARAARYALLVKAARAAGAHHILTAHTLDDQAETVLLRMSRGSGLTGLAAMARVTPLGDVFLVRPFLDIPKTRLLATLAAGKIPFAEDSSNHDPRFTRVRLRDLMPALTSEGLDAQRFGQLARRLRRAEAAIEVFVDAAVTRLSPGPWLDHGPVEFDAVAFKVLPAEVALRLLGRAVARVGDEGLVELGKLEALFEALSSSLSQSRQKAARFRRTLAGAMVTAAGGGLTVERAPARRSRMNAVKSGRRGGPKHGKRSFTKRQ